MGRWSRFNPWKRKPAIALSVVEIERELLIPADPSVEARPLFVSWKRLQTLLDVSPLSSKIGRRPALVDTGACFSLFPEDYWTKVKDRITFLTKVPDRTPFLSPTAGTELPVWLTTITGIGGASIPCRPGLIGVRLLDEAGRQLSPATILGLFAADRTYAEANQKPEAVLRSIILGLHAIMDGLKVKIASDGTTIWLTEL